MMAVAGRIEVTVPDVSAHVELLDRLPVIVADEPMAPLTVKAIRAAIDGVRGSRRGT